MLAYMSVLVLLLMLMLVRVQACGYEGAYVCH